MLERLAARATVAVASLTLLVSGCTYDTDFTIKKTVDPVSSVGGSTPFTVVRDVDLAAEAPGAWKRRDRVKSLDLVGLDATVTSVHSGGPTTGDGSIVVSRNGTDVVVGSWTAEPLPAAANVPHSINASFNAAAISLINQALHDDGRFSVKATGSTAAAYDFAAEVSLHLRMSYKFP